MRAGARERLESRDQRLVGRLVLLAALHMLGDVLRERLQSVCEGDAAALHDPHPTRRDAKRA